MSGVAAWALPISIIAAVALVVQFVAFGAAAREARASAPGRRVTRFARRHRGGRPAPAPAAPRAGRSRRAAAARRRLPRLGARPRARPPAAATGFLHGLAGYAGLCQRVFVGLLVAWTLLVALGLLAS